MKNVDKEDQFDINEGSYWFKRLVREITSSYPDVEFRKIKYGFYRIYWRGSGYPAYIGECYKELPEVGYEIYDNDIFFESKKYYEEFEDTAELTRKIKNFVEGYWEMMDHLKTRLYMVRNNTEYRNMCIQQYKQMVIK